MGTTSLRQHIRAINACNQRGGRMLSLVDLVDAETMNLEMAGYLAAVMRSGASLLVGANPGGAGKTAVMCALLNFLPDTTRLRAIESRAVLTEGLRDNNFGETCYLAHEISPATYYFAYIWGQDVQKFFRLAGRGHLVASNLHADTLDEAKDQLCQENGVPFAHLDEITLKVFIGTERRGGWSMRRWLRRVYESDGSGSRLIWEGRAPGAFRRVQAESRIVSPSEELAYTDFLEDLGREDVRRIEDVRRTVLERSPS
ncbi:MAG: hypothetical protein ACP5GX_09755 [Anaerolineae bacterium]